MSIHTVFDCRNESIFSGGFKLESGLWACVGYSVKRPIRGDFVINADTFTILQIESMEEPDEKPHFFTAYLRETGAALQTKDEPAPTADEINEFLAQEHPSVEDV